LKIAREMVFGAEGPAAGTKVLEEQDRPHEWMWPGLRVTGDALRDRT
jgi:hypothetical protein